ncbi:hypothetical protein ACR6C2_05910 [Streptomyces sp. INA 01156]
MSSAESPLGEGDGTAPGPTRPSGLLDVLRVASVVLDPRDGSSCGVLRPRNCSATAPRRRWAGTPRGSWWTSGTWTW